VQACCDNEAILRTVEDKIEIFKQKLSKSPNTAELRAQICVVFSDKKQKRNMLGFVKVENVIWEEWVIGVRLLPPRNETGVCSHALSFTVSPGFCGACWIPHFTQWTSAYFTTQTLASGNARLRATYGRVWNMSFKSATASMIMSPASQAQNYCHFLSRHVVFCRLVGLPSIVALGRNDA
jgi:hypothetical protein